MNNFPDYREMNGISTYETFVFPMSCNNLRHQFYTFIDRIVPFKVQKNTWKDIVKDIFPEVIFFGCVLEFLNYVVNIEEVFRDYYKSIADEKKLEEDEKYRQMFYTEQEQILSKCTTEFPKSSRI